jgi:hypothetical protein
MGSSNSSVEPGGGVAVNKKQVLHFVQDDKLFGVLLRSLDGLGFGIVAGLTFPGEGIWD